MLVELKTARNTYGHRNYLAFDVEKRVFTRNCPRMVVDGIEIKKRDYNDLVRRLENHGFVEVEYL